MAVEALDRSAVKLLQEKAPLPDFQEGYSEWRSAFDAGQAGIFTVTVAEAVEFAETALNGGPGAGRSGLELPNPAPAGAEVDRSGTFDATLNYLVQLEITWCNVKSSDAT